MWFKVLTLLPALWGMIREIWDRFKKPKQETCKPKQDDVE